MGQILVPPAAAKITSQLNDLERHLTVYRMRFG
jgi:hypothetical protein